MNIIIANIFGFISLLISIYMYQANTKKDLLLRQIFYTIFMLIEFIFLNAYVAFLVSLISLIRTLIYYYYQKTNRKIPILYLVLIVVLFLLSLLFNYQNIFSFIPVIIGISYTIALLIKNVNKIKIICIILAILWIIYYLVIHAYVSIITRIIDIIAILYSIKKDFKK